MRRSSAASSLCAAGVALAALVLAMAGVSAQPQPVQDINYPAAACSVVVSDFSESFNTESTTLPVGSFAAVPGDTIFFMPFTTPSSVSVASSIQVLLDDNTGTLYPTAYPASGVVAARFGIFVMTAAGDSSTTPPTNPQFALLQQTEQIVVTDPTFGVYNATLVNALGQFATFTAPPNTQLYLGEWFNSSIYQPYADAVRSFATEQNAYNYSAAGFPAGNIVAPLTVDTSSGPETYNTPAGGINDIPIQLAYCTAPSSSVVGDPQFSGLRGQQYQVHGIDGAYYNLITSASTQVNARFVYLNSGVCPRPPPSRPAATNCWSHPGSYLGAVGVMERVDGETHYLALEAGAAARGFANVSLDGVQLTVGSSVTMGSLTVQYEDSHYVTVQTAQFSFAFDSSDRFVNQQVSSRVPVTRLTAHGLLGQTHSARRYPTALKYIAGQVDDYVLADQSLFGVDFPYNQFPTQH